MKLSFCRHLNIVERRVYVDYLGEDYSMCFPILDYWLDYQQTRASADAFELFESFDRALKAMKREQVIPLSSDIILSLVGHQLEA